mgnify:CR=1 FL=1
MTSFENINYSTSNGKIYIYKQNMTTGEITILNALDEVCNIPQLYQSKEEYFNLYQIALKSAGPSLEKLFPTNRIKEIIDNRFL